MSIFLFASGILLGFFPNFILKSPCISTSDAKSGARALADRRRVAIRPSGTEPTIKYYMFGAKVPGAGKTFSPAEVAEARESVKSSLARLWENLSADAKARLA